MGEGKQDETAGFTAETRGRGGGRGGGGRRIERQGTGRVIDSNDYYRDRTTVQDRDKHLVKACWQTGIRSASKNELSAQGHLSYPVL